MRLVHHESPQPGGAKSASTTPVPGDDAKPPQAEDPHVSPDVADTPVLLSPPVAGRLFETRREESDNAFWQTEPPPRQERRVEPPGESPNEEEDKRDISGPSFLGLNGAGTPNSSVEYLYDDGAGRSGAWRKLIALAIAIAFIAFIVHEWRQNPSWQSSVARYWPVKLRQTPDSAAATTGSQPAVSSTNQTSATGPAQSGDVPPPPDSSQMASLSGSSADSNMRRLATDPNDRAVTEIQMSNLSKKTATNKQNSKSRSEEKASATKPSENSVASTRSNSKEAREKQVASAAKPSRAPVAKPVNETPPEPPGSDLVKKADAYLYGRGVPRNCEQALTYLLGAANQGNAVARGKLGTLYATGHCVRMDNVRAYSWFSLAIEAGGKDPLLVRNRRMIWNKMSATEQARARQLEP